jgi:hypothetical protein
VPFLLSYLGFTRATISNSGRHISLWWYYTIVREDVPRNMTVPIYILASMDATSCCSFREATPKHMPVSHCPLTYDIPIVSRRQIRCFHYPLFISCHGFSLIYITVHMLLVILCQALVDFGLTAVRAAKANPSVPFPFSRDCALPSPVMGFPPSDTCTSTGFRR